MWHRIVRKIAFQVLKLRILPYTKLEAHAALVTQTEIDRAQTKLKPYYDYYVANISRADMAMSLELAAFVYTLCEKKRFKSLLDLGSGFSSFVFRLYASTQNDVQVVSVDDDSQWLEKTRGYLRDQGLSDTKLLTLEHFLQQPLARFDCVLHDLNFVEVRIRYVKHVLAATADEGLLILDDVHKQHYLHQALEGLRHESVSIYDLKPVTLDSFGRYALVVVKS